MMILIAGIATVVFCVSCGALILLQKVDYHSEVGVRYHSLLVGILLVLMVVSFLIADGIGTVYLIRWAATSTLF